MHVIALFIKAGDGCGAAAYHAGRLLGLALLHFVVCSRCNKSDLAHVDGTGGESPRTELGGIFVGLAGQFEIFLHGYGAVIQILDLSFTGVFGDLAGPTILVWIDAAGVHREGGHVCIAKDKEAGTALDR